MTFDDDRIIGLEYNNNIKLLLLGIYCHVMLVTILKVFSLGKIKSIIDECDSSYVYVSGEFNADIVRQTSFRKELASFCSESELIIADSAFLYREFVSHVNDAHETESWLDHVMCTKGAYGLKQESIFATLYLVQTTSQCLSSSASPVQVQWRQMVSTKSIPR